MGDDALNVLAWVGGAAAMLFLLLILALGWLVWVAGKDPTRRRD